MRKLRSTKLWICPKPECGRGNHYDDAVCYACKTPRAQEAK
jgi:hypothetical protein